MLSQGRYLGNPDDIGFDLPETHVIRKQQTLYYAFYPSVGRDPLSFAAWKAEPMTSLTTSTERILNSIGAMPPDG